jgi:hypothetical protein
MPSSLGNALNITEAGVQTFNGTSSFAGSTGTQYTVVLWNSSNQLTGVSGVGTAGQVLTSAGASANPTWASPGVTSFPWTDEVTSFSVAKSHGYFVTGTATGSLAASPAQGDTVEFVVTSGNMLTIQANTGQTISIGANSSSSGGTAINTVIGDSVTLVYQLASTTWLATSVIGVWTLA